MALSINTNVASLQTQVYLKLSGDSLDKTIGQLASGIKIQKASDDASGIGISKNLSYQIAGYDQTSRNDAFALSMTDYEFSGLNQFQTILTRMSVLAINALNGTNDTAALSALSSEFNTLADTITRLSQTASFNGIYVFQSGSAITIQTGITTGTYDSISVSVYDMSLSGLGLSSLSFTSTSLSSVAHSTAALTAVVSAINKVNADIASVGGEEEGLQQSLINSSSSSFNLAAANALIIDTDFAESTSNFNAQNIRQQAGVAMLAQANSQPQLVLSLLRF